MTEKYYIVRKGTRSAPFSMHQLRALAHKGRLRDEDEILIDRESVITALGPVSTLDWLQASPPVAGGRQRATREHDGANPRSHNQSHWIRIALIAVIAASPFVMTVPLVLRNRERLRLNAALRTAIAEVDTNSSNPPDSQLLAIETVLRQIESAPQDMLDPDVAEDAIRLGAMKVDVERDIRAATWTRAAAEEGRRQAAMEARRAADAKAAAERLAQQARAADELDRLAKEKKQAEERAAQFARMNQPFSVRGTAIASLGLAAPAPLRGVRVLLLPAQIPVARRMEIDAKLRLRIEQTMQRFLITRATDHREWASLDAISKSLDAAMRTFTSAFKAAGQSPSARQDLAVVLKALEACASSTRERLHSAIRLEANIHFRNRLPFDESVKRDCNQAHEIYLEEIFRGGDATVDPDSLEEILALTALSELRADQNGDYQFHGVLRGDYLLVCTHVFAGSAVVMMREIHLDEQSLGPFNLTDSEIGLRTPGPNPMTAQSIIIDAQR